MKIKLKNHKLLLLGTIIYFLLSFVNIHFAIAAMLCMITPFILVLRDRKKTWCQGYCPRASLFSATGRLSAGHGRKTPASFIKGNVKWYVLAYFGLNLLIIAGTTFRVASGQMAAMDYPRLLFFLRLGSGLPQLLPSIDMPSWLVHFSYRFFSMMLTTTIFGLVLSLLYKPRTWCTICPIATMSDIAVKKMKS